MAKQRIMLSAVSPALAAILSANNNLEILDEIPNSEEKKTKAGKSEKVRNHSKAKQEKKRRNRAKQAGGHRP